MKKIALIVFLLVSHLSVFGQFTLTPNGLVNLENARKNYIVLEFENKTQQDIYSAVNVYLHSLYISPQNVLSSTGNDAITINGISRDVIIIKSKNIKGEHLAYDIRYTI